MKLSLLQRTRVLFTGKFPTTPVSHQLPAGEEKAAGDHDRIHSVMSVAAGSTAGTYSPEKALRNFAGSSWVYACTRRIAESAASVPWRVEVQVGEDDWQPYRHKHPLGELLNRPNEKWSRSTLMQMISYHQMLTGNALIYKVRGMKDQVVELWTVPPDSIAPVVGRDQVGDYYAITKPEKYVVPSKDIVHMMLVNPADPVWGIGPLEVAHRSVSTDSQALDYQDSSMANRATPDGILAFAHPLNKEQYEHAIRMIKEQRSGPDNARGIMVMGSEARYQQLGLSPVEMDFLNTRKFTREEICSIFGVPPPMVGIYENATLANIETARLILWLDTVIPFMDGIASTLNLQLAPEFGPEIRIMPDYSSIPALAEYLRQLSGTAQAYHSLGVPFNTINRKLGLGFDRVPGGDTGFVQSGLTPVELLSLEGGYDPADWDSFAAGLTQEQVEEVEKSRPVLMQFFEAKAAYLEAPEETREGFRYRAAFLAEQCRLQGHAVSLD